MVFFLKEGITSYYFGLFRTKKCWVCKFLYAKECALFIFLLRVFSERLLSHRILMIIVRLLSNTLAYFTPSMDPPSISELGLRSLG